MYRMVRGRGVMRKEYRGGGEYLVITRWGRGRTPVDCLGWATRGRGAVHESVNVPKSYLGRRNYMKRMRTMMEKKWRK